MVILFIIVTLLYLLNISLVGAIYDELDLEINFWTVVFIITPIANTIYLICHYKVLTTRSRFLSFSDFWNKK